MDVHVSIAENHVQKSSNFEPENSFLEPKIARLVAKRTLFRKGLKSIEQQIEKFEPKISTLEPNCRSFAPIIVFSAQDFGGNVRKFKNLAAQVPPSEELRSD